MLLMDGELVQKGETEYPAATTYVHDALGLRSGGEPLVEMRGGD